MLMEDNCLAIMSMTWPMVVLGTGLLAGGWGNRRRSGYVLNDGSADDIVLDGSPNCPLEGEDDVTPAGGRGMIHVTLSEDGKPGILPVDIQGSSDQILEGYWFSEQNRDPWTILTWKVDLFIWNILKNMLILDLIIDKKLENYCLEIWVWY